MREPDAWWDHIPVVSRYYTNFGKSWEWHIHQVREAITVVSSKYPEALALIPDSGFYIMAGRKTEHYIDMQHPDDIVVVAALWEDMQGNAYSEVDQVAIRPEVCRQDIETVDSGANPFSLLFEKLARKVPHDWPIYLDHRKRTVQGPLPQWLLRLQLG